jgi:hypothetical protein
MEGTSLFGRLLLILMLLGLNRQHSQQKKAHLALDLEILSFDSVISVITFIFVLKTNIKI